MVKDSIIRDKVVPLLRELIQNRCVNDGTAGSGHETRSVKTLQKFFKGYKIESQVLAKDPERGNLLVRVPGTDPMAPALMFMGHLDVVPAVESDWSCDPFSGVEQDGYIWGRGALDMLSLTASMAVVLAESVGAGRQFPGDICFLAVADEEAGGELGAQWLVENHWGQVAADYMITELGGYSIGTSDHPKLAIAVGEKGQAWTKLSFTGTAGHGSMPMNSDNAAVKAAEAVVKLNGHRPPLSITSEFLGMVGGVLERTGHKKVPKKDRAIDTFINRLFESEPYLAKLLHTATRLTLSPNVIRAGRKINIIASHGEVFIDGRVISGQGVEDVQLEIGKALGPLNDEVDLEFLSFFPPNSSPSDTKLMEATQKIVSDIYPSAELIPWLNGGITDGRFWRQKGSIVYGFSLYDKEMDLSEFISRLHGRDERISIDSLKTTFEYLYRLPELFYSMNPETV
jgi:acetylornithine deacetylase/succinyl-diaminopimelate desuccinylase-like protein